MKFHTKALFLTLLIAVLLNACGETKLSGEADDPLEVVSNAFQEAAYWESCSLSMRSFMTILSKDSEENTDTVWTQMRGEGVIFVDPLKSHFLMSMVQETISETSVNIEQYMEETEEGLVVYLKSDEGWLKYIAEYDTQIPSSGANPMENITEMRKYLIGAEFLQADRINDRDSLKYEATFSKEMYENLLASSPISLKSSGDETVTYNVWLEKESGDVLKYEAIIDHLSDSEGKWEVTLGVDVDLFAHDAAVKDFDIPQEVIVAAKEVE